MDGSRHEEGGNSCFAYFDFADHGEEQRARCVSAFPASLSIPCKAFAPLLPVRVYIFSPVRLVIRRGSLTSVAYLCLSNRTAQLEFSTFASSSPKDHMSEEAHGAKAKGSREEDRGYDENHTEKGQGGHRSEGRTQGKRSKKGKGKNTEEEVYVEDDGPEENPDGRKMPTGLAKVRKIHIEPNTPD